MSVPILKLFLLEILVFHKHFCPMINQKPLILYLKRNYTITSSFYTIFPIFSVILFTHISLFITSHFSLYSESIFLLYRKVYSFILFMLFFCFVLLFIICSLLSIISSHFSVCSSFKNKVKKNVWSKMKN